MKACSYCKVVRDLLLFAKNARASDNLCSKCKVCQKAYNDSRKAEKRESGIAYRANHADRIKAVKRAHVVANMDWKRESNAKWAAENKEKVLASSRKFRAANPEKTASYLKDWCSKNPGKRTEFTKRWRKKNPGLAREAVARRRAALIQATPAWADREKIRYFYSVADFLTKLLGERYEVDHKIPLRGKTVMGLHVETNLQILTKSENCKKNAKIIEAHTYG